MGPDYAEYFAELPAMPEAACRNHPNPDFFFPEDIRNFEQRVFASASAFAACDSCPIQAKCLAFGMEPENIRYGIYGGLMPGERLTLAKKLSGRINNTLIAEAKKVRRALLGIRTAA